MVKRLQEGLITLRGYIIVALIVLASSLGVSLNTLTNWLRSCGGFCTVPGLCSDLSKDIGKCGYTYRDTAYYDLLGHLMLNLYLW